MKNIKKTSDIVKFILQTNPQTRNCKDYLVRCVHAYINKDCLGMTYEQVMMNRKDIGLPPYGSITRSMRKLQNAYPELRPNEDVAGWRAVNEEIVKGYARSVKV